MTNWDRVSSAANRWDDVSDPAVSVTGAELARKRMTLAGEAELYRQAVEDRKATIAAQAEADEAARVARLEKEKQDRADRVAKEEADNAERELTANGRFKAEGAEGKLNTLRREREIEESDAQRADKLAHERYRSGRIHIVTDRICGVFERAAKTGIYVGAGIAAITMAMAGLALLFNVVTAESASVPLPEHGRAAPPLEWQHEQPVPPPVHGKRLYREAHGQKDVAALSAREGP